MICRKHIKVHWTLSSCNWLHGLARLIKLCRCNSPHSRGASWSWFGSLVQAASFQMIKSIQNSLRIRLICTVLHRQFGVMLVNFICLLTFHWDLFESVSSTVSIITWSWWLLQHSSLGVMPQKRNSAQGIQWVLTMHWLSTTRQGDNAFGSICVHLSVCRSIWVCESSFSHLQMSESFHENYPGDSLFIKISHYHPKMTKKLYSAAG